MRKFVQGVVEIRSSKLGQLKQGAGRELGAGSERGTAAKSKEQGAGSGGRELGTGSDLSDYDYDYEQERRMN
jgi:hypothetical protein